MRTSFMAFTFPVALSTLALALCATAPLSACSSTTDDSDGGTDGGSSSGDSGTTSDSGSDGGTTTKCLDDNATVMVKNNGTTAWVIDTKENPTLTLCRGRTVKFDLSGLDSKIHPFYIKTKDTVGSSDGFDSGVTNQGAIEGTVTFAVPASAPDKLFYQCANHAKMTGILNIVAAQ